MQEPMQGTILPKDSCKESLAKNALQESLVKKPFKQQKRRIPYKRLKLDDLLLNKSDLLRSAATQSATDVHKLQSHVVLLLWNLSIVSLDDICVCSKLNCTQLTELYHLSCIIVEDERRR